MAHDNNVDSMYVQFNFYDISKEKIDMAQDNLSIASIGISLIGILIISVFSIGSRIGDNEVYGLIQVGNQEDRPVSAVQDQWYYANDTDQLFYWNVTAWYEVPLGGGSHTHTESDITDLHSPPQIWEADATTMSPSTSSSSFTLLPEMTLTINVKNGYNYLFLFYGNFYSGTAQSGGVIKLVDVNGVMTFGGDKTARGESAFANQRFSLVINAMGECSATQQATFEIHWRMKISGTFYSGGKNRRFQIIEYFV